MTDARIQPTHLQRDAFVYVRQSSRAQVQRNPESTRRQYALVERARALGWDPARIHVVDDDLGQTAAFAHDRDGFSRLASEIALRRVGLLLGLEVSRLARNNTDWYRLLDLCALTDTLIADTEGIYHPALYNDRLLLGLKGTMSEAELFILRGRLAEAIRAKAARGELRCALPVGYVWGREDGQVLFHPDDEVTGAISTVFERFAALGSVRRVWLWFLDQGLCFPMRAHLGAPIRWLPPSYHAIGQVLANAVYAGAYVFGKTRSERYLDADGSIRQRIVRLPRSQWRVLLPDHHEGYIDWATYEANQQRIRSNGRPQASGAGAVREGTALLQGLALCGHCGRRLHTEYRSKQAPGYYCAGTKVVERQGRRCLSIGGAQIDRAVSQAVLAALQPGAMEAVVGAAEQLEAGRERELEPRRLAVERAAREAQQAESDFDLINKRNLRVAAKYETRLEASLERLEGARAELAACERRRPRVLQAHEREALLALGADLQRVWDAPTTAPRDRKEVLRALLEEAVLTAPRDEPRAQVELVWQGGQRTALEIERPQARHAPTIRTPEDTVELVRRLAVYHDDGVIAGILSRQGKVTAHGLPFTAPRVRSLRKNWKIPSARPPGRPAAKRSADGPTVNVRQAARELAVAPSTIHRWINDGFLPAEQVTPGAPWRIRLTPELRARLAEEAPEGYLAMREAIRRLGVSRQTVLQWVKRGKLEAVMVYRGKRKGLRIKVLDDHPSLFEQNRATEEAV